MPEWCAALRCTALRWQTIVAEEGAKALFKGFNARVLYITPICSMSFAVYEWVKHKSLA